MGCRIPMREASSVVPMRNDPSKEQEASTAAVVKAGNPDSEIAMIGRPPMLLGALKRLEWALTGSATSDSERFAAASILIWSSHRPHRLLAADFLSCFSGLNIGGVEK